MATTKSIKYPVWYTYVSYDPLSLPDDGGAHATFYLSSPMAQVVLVGFTCFATVGMFSAVSNLGAGGLSDIGLSDTSQGVLYGCFALAGLFSGGINNAEVPPNMSGILDAPKIDSVTEGKWTVAMDGVYVNGEFLDGDSDFAEAYRSAGMLVPAGNTIATFDTGTSYIRAPPLYAHRIYKDLPGAELLAEDDVPPGRGLVIYEVPCDTKINITWTSFVAPDSTLSDGGLP
ncbi:hypothetical protein C8Q77DRAFT_1157280 [Trametes polyzona]|nr:hypothetical protein C8Q77DRAFT_1157280 [Trametes polyzona]